MASGSSYIAGGALISVSVCRVTFSDLLHLFTATTMRTPMETPRAMVTRNVRVTERATVAPVEKDVTVNKQKESSDKQVQ